MKPPASAPQIVIQTFCWNSLMGTEALPATAAAGAAVACVTAGAELAVGARVVGLGGCGVGAGCARVTPN